MRQKWILITVLLFFFLIQAHGMEIGFAFSAEFCGQVKNISAQDKIDPCNILTSFFTQKGFVTGVISIPELGIRVKLKENQFYKKEDNVTDVYARINEIRNQFGLSNPYSDIASGNGWCGVLYAECYEHKAFAYVVLIKDRLNDSSYLYTTAHENGHFLWYIGQQEKVYEKFTNSDHIKSCTQNNSDFAVLCGWTAMKMAGYSLKDCYILKIGNKAEGNNIERIKNLVDRYFDAAN
jgi:hypothetical protein